MSLCRFSVPLLLRPLFRIFFTRKVYSDEKIARNQTCVRMRGEIFHPLPSGPRGHVALSWVLPANHARSLGVCAYVCERRATFSSGSLSEPQATAVATQSAEGSLQIMTSDVVSANSFSELSGQNTGLKNPVYSDQWN
jgi:hypothetical protein